MVSGEGGKEAQLGDLDEFTMGSDHELYQESSWKIPAIYMNDWPDRYIHTNFDSAANIDPTKLRRAAFIGAASGYFLANFSQHDVVSKAAIRSYPRSLWRRKVSFSDRSKQRFQCRRVLLERPR